MAAGPHSTDAWREVLALFDRWALLEGDARSEELQRVQAEQPALYPRLIALIDADRAAESQGFLGDGASPVVGEPVAPNPSWAGTRLGAWTLHEPIGHGGMGEVWLATRSDGLYSGRAAVKLLHAAGIAPQAQARFAREGELLGRLSHPHIAQLFDAGLTGHGTRYLVLEYVQGERIDHWCDTRRLGVAERLRLLMQVCEAVAYAHAHLVVHRDLKPANILVTDAGHVKLLDFGVAKLLAGDDEGAGELTELTRAGAAGLTPEYAAPEQIEGLPITTATDVYALGVVLFGLLSGARPYGSTSRGVAALARAIVEEPPRSLTAAMRESPDAALSRNTTEAALAHALKGDLETIVARALKKSPDERYATVQELREDLQRHLDHQPVSAQPDTFGYRARKFAQRNRAQVLALGALVVTLVAGVVATSWQWRAATQEAERTRSVVQVLTRIFTDLAPDETGAAQVRVLDLLRKGWGQAQATLKEDAVLRAEVARPLGLMLGASGDMVSAISALSESRAHLAASGQTHTPQYLEVLQALAYAQSRIGKTDEARALLNELIAVAPRDQAASLPEVVNAQIQLGEIARREGHLDDARRQLAAAADTARQRLGPEHALHVLALQEQADVLREQGQWQRTRELLASIVQATRHGKPSEALAARFNEASLNVEMGHYAAAIPQLRELMQEMGKLYGPDDTYTIYSATWLSMALFHTGAFDDADAASRTATQRAATSTEPNVRQTVQNLVARQLLRRGHCASAVPLLQENLAYYEAAGATARPAALRTRMLLGECELRAGRPAAALKTLDAVLDAQRGLYGPRHLDLWPTLLLRALAIDVSSGIGRAVPVYEEACAVALAMLPPEHPDRLKAQLYRDQARWRAQPSAPARQALVSAHDAYAAYLRTRPDGAGFSVLSSKLLDLGPAAALSKEPLLTLLTY